MAAPLNCNIISEEEREDIFNTLSFNLIMKYNNMKTISHARTIKDYNCPVEILAERLDFLESTYKKLKVNNLEFKPLHNNIMRQICNNFIISFEAQLGTYYTVTIKEVKEYINKFIQKN